MLSDRFDPLAILRLLHDHGVAFVVIGGVAARLHGSPSVTADVDVCYDRATDNLERLAAALQAVHALLRGVDPSLPFHLDARTLRMGDHFTFSTDLGDLDCLGVPAGTHGYGDLASEAVVVALEGLPVAFASLDHLILMKRAASRPKDRVEVEILEALRQEMEAGEL